MNTDNRIADIRKRLKQGTYYVPYAPDDIEYLLSELDKARLERNKFEANKNYYKKQLVAYKKSGLSPEEVQQLAKTKAEGRLVVLPCKVGDAVYEVSFVHQCSGCPANHIGKCKYDKQDVECKESEWIIREVEFSYEMFSLYTGKLKRGLFLTREAAEKALGGGEG